MAQRGRGRGRAGLEHHPEGEHPERARRTRSVGHVQCGDGDAVAVLQHADPRHGRPREPKHPSPGVADDVLRPLADPVGAPVEIPDFDDCDSVTVAGHVRLRMIAYSMRLA